jgi:hypothetical protein
MTLHGRTAKLFSSRTHARELIGLRVDRRISLDFRFEKMSPPSFLLGIAKIPVRITLGQ